MLYGKIVKEKEEKTCSDFSSKRNKIK